MPSTSQGVDLNKASLSELTKLPMVGEQRAQFIMDARPFKDWNDMLERVPGFSKGMVEDIARGGATIDGESWDEIEDNQGGSSQRGGSQQGRSQEGSRGSRSNDDEEEGQGDDEEGEKGSGRGRSGRERDSSGQFAKGNDEGSKSHGGHSSHGGHRGEVKSEDDGRLKENRDRGTHKGDRDD